MDEKKYTYRAVWAVFTGSALLVILLFVAWLSEGRSRQWRAYQQEYRDLLETAAGGQTGPVDFPEQGILQVELPQLDRVDRCISCHSGLEDSHMEGAPPPHSSHPGSFLEDHPVQQYGCTICHGGQGRALTTASAHGMGEQEHWPQPLLRSPYIQSSCGKCHLAVFSGSDLAREGVRGNGWMPSGGPDLTGDQQIPEGSWSRDMEVLLSGRSLFSSEGCLGCHQARGVGGILGPDLTQQGEKTKHDYSFSNVQGEQTVSNWLKEHFKDPEMVSPGSQMLRIDLQENELDALATFVMGLAKPDIPIDYFSMETLSEFKGIREEMGGSRGYSSLCSACHGKQGEGKGYLEYETGIPAIGNTDFLRVASEDFIRFTLEKGRSLRQMASWATEVSGATTGEVDRITEHLKEKVRRSYPGMDRYRGGSAVTGSRLFEENCRSCHGSGGDGGVAVALNQPDLMERADDSYFIRTLLRGRENTAMPAWPDLEEGELADLLSYLRSWYGFRGTRGPMELEVTDITDGYLKYHFLCSRCHGDFGEGETGPAIINLDFLEVADDRFLYETIALGRSHTAMFGWSAHLYNQEQLGRSEIANIIGYMRQTAREPLTYIHQGANPGNHQTGALLYADHCAECHGASGEGTEGPALQNQEFLSAASNGYILATLTLGREGTRMPSWGYGDAEYPELSGPQRQDLVAYLRAWQRIRIRY